MKGQMNINIIIMGYWNTPLLYWVKTNKENSKQNNTTDQLDLTDIYRIFHPIDIEHTSFFGPMGTSIK